MSLEMRCIDTREGLLAEMFPEPHGLFVSVADLLAYLDQTAAIMSGSTIRNAPAQTIATLAQELAEKLGLSD